MRHALKADSDETADAEPVPALAEKDTART
jgi:hypothetical protein